MTIGRFLKDYYLYMLIAAAIATVTGIFLSAFSLPPHAVLFVLMLFAVAFIFFFAREYIKRKRYYTALRDLFDKLDKKFLIAELMDAGDFAYSAIFYEILQRAGKSMNDEIAAYKLRSEDYAEFLEGWVHEIKTPIASARMTIENNRSPVTDRIDEDIMRIERYVQNVLFYARSSIVEKDYLIREVTLAQLVSKALKENSKLLIENKIEVRMEELDIAAFTDEKWMVFILGQIIANSVKYAQAGNAIVRFWGEDTPQGALLHIADNGIGIPPADLPRIFDKGFTGENGRKYAKSTGIGLYLCKKLCGKLGAHIYAKSEHGTEIVLTFPKTDMFFR